MVDVEQLVDPELEGLLRELGSRPRSVFLRSSRKYAGTRYSGWQIQKNARTVAGEIDRATREVTEGVSALAIPDSLERELVTVHRAELAEILKQACRTRLLEGERERLFMMPYKRRDERHTPTILAALQAQPNRAERIASESAMDDFTNATSDATSPRRFLALPVLELVAIGERIQPSDTWRLMAAISFIANRMSDPARELAHAVLRGWPSDNDALRALEIAALAECMEGRPDVALELQDRACSIGGDYPIGAINRLRYALLAVKEERAVDASDRLDASIPSDHALVPQTCSANRARKEAGEWTPSQGAVELARRLSPRLGPVAREVSRVFQ